MVRLTNRPDMTLDVYRGRKTTMQQQQQQNRKIGFFNAEASVGGQSSYILLFKNNDNCFKI